MTNFRIVNNCDAHVARLNDQDAFSSRNRQSRTDGTAKKTPSTNSPATAKRVEVNSFYFANGRTFKSFPASITLEDKQYAFKTGLQLLVRRGSEVIKLFSMTDGLMTYRLRQENGCWTLIGLEPVA